MRGNFEVTYRMKRPAGSYPALMGSATRHWPRRLRLIACALLVLVVGVAGAASAAVLIGSKQVKDNSLTGRDLRLGTVRGSDVRDHSLQPQDFDVVPHGPTGPQGGPGFPGSNGSPGITVVTLTPTIPASSTVPVEVPCTAPQRAVSGSTISLPSLVELRQSAPGGDGLGSSWGFVIRNRNVVEKTVTLQALCVTDR
jgi:hypothetical protein